MLSGRDTNYSCSGGMVGERGREIPGAPAYGGSQTTSVRRLGEGSHHRQSLSQSCRRRESVSESPVRE